MPYYKYSNYSIYYEYEVKSDKTIVFIHGLGGSIHQVKNIYRNANNISTLYIDMQGHGKSTTDFSNYNFDQFSLDIKNILDYLNISSIYLAGISMGAATALNFTLAYPSYVNKLILIRNAWINHPMEQRFVDLYNDVADSLSNKDISKLINNPSFMNFKKKSSQAANSIIAYFDDPASIKYYKKFILLPKTMPFIELQQLTHIKAQTLVLANHFDPIHPFNYSELISSAINSSKLIEITSKEINTASHVKDINKYIELFI